MKESIGYTATLNIVIVFITVIFAVFAMSLSYYRAYKVSNKITESIEKYEGYNYLSEAEIKTKLTALGYNFSSVSCKESLGGCPLYTPTYQDDVDNSIKVSKYSGELGYCVYTCPGSKNNSVKYKVTTNMMWNIPIVNNILNIPVETKTREIYGIVTENYELSFNNKTYNCTGKVEEFVVPKTGVYQIEIKGGSGGSCTEEELKAHKQSTNAENHLFTYTTNANISTCSGGKGAYVKGEVLLYKGQKLYITVGCEGKGAKGGYNGGADGFNAGTTPVIPAAYGGGGATDIRLVKNDLSTRIMVAGGGGGAQLYWWTSSGGNAGIEYGEDGNFHGHTCNLYNMEVSGTCRKMSFSFNTKRSVIKNPGFASEWGESWYCIRHNEKKSRYEFQVVNSCVENSVCTLKAGAEGTPGVLSFYTGKIRGNGGGKAGNMVKGASVSNSSGGGGGGYYSGESGTHATCVIGSGGGGSSFVSGYNTFSSVEGIMFKNVVTKVDNVGDGKAVITLLD